jgi:hypothetical protein
MNQQAVPSDLAGAFSTLATLLDDHLTRNPKSGGLLEMLLYRKATNFKEFLPNLRDSAEKDIAMVLLFQMINSRQIQQEVQKHTELNMQDFKTPNAAFKYVDAIIESGAFTEAKTTVSVLGNTNVGKSSLVRTLSNFCLSITQKTNIVRALGDVLLNPKKRPIPYLTRDNPQFLATKVLELVEDVDFKAQPFMELEIKQDKDQIKLNIVSYKQSSIPSTDKSALKPPFEKLTVTFVDFAGHTHYKSCSSLFTSENGVYMIAFDAPKYLEFEASKNFDPYHPSIGTYLELITRSCPEPIFILVATKTELCPAGRYDSILQTAKAHLKSIANRSSKLQKVVLFDEVIKTSSAKATKANFEELCGKIFAVSSHEDLLDVRERNYPKAWKKMIDGTKGQVKIPLHEIQKDYESIYSQCEKNQDTVTEGLEGWRNVAEKVIKDQTIKDSVEEEHFVPAEVHHGETPGLPAEEDKNNQTLDIEEPMQQTINLEGCSISQEVNEEGEKQVVFKISEELDNILSVFASDKKIFWFR